MSPTNDSGRDVKVVEGMDNLGQVLRTLGEADEAAVKLGFLSAEDFDKYVKPESMTQPG